MMKSVYLIIENHGTRWTVWHQTEDYADHCTAFNLGLDAGMNIVRVAVREPTDDVSPNPRLLPYAIPLRRKG